MRSLSKEPGTLGFLRASGSEKSTMQSYNAVAILLLSILIHKAVGDPVPSIGEKFEESVASLIETSLKEFFPSGTSDGALLALAGLRDALTAPFENFKIDGNEAEHHDHQHHHHHSGGSASILPAVTFGQSEISGGQWHNYLRPPLLPTLVPPSEGHAEHGHFSPYQVSNALIGAKEAYLDYLQDNLDTGFLEAVLNVTQVSHGIDIAGNCTGDESAMPQLVQNFESGEIAVLKGVRAFNEHLPEKYSHEPGIALAKHYADLAFLKALPPSDAGNAYNALRGALESLSGMLLKRCTDVPEFLNAGYQTYIAALPPTIPLVDAVVAAHTRLDQSLKGNKPALLFDALGNLALALNFAFPGEPEGLLSAKIAAEEAFWEHFPKTGELASIMAGLEDGSIIPALIAGKEAWERYAPQCPAREFILTFMNECVAGNVVGGVSAAAMAYREAVISLMREQWKLEETLERAKLFAEKTFHSILREKPTLPPIYPPIFPPTLFPPTIYPPTIYPPTVYPPTIYPPTIYPPTIFPPTSCPPEELVPTPFPDGYVH